MTSQDIALPPVEDTIAKVLPKAWTKLGVI